MKTLRNFFVFLGVIFFLLLLSIGYVWATDWSGVRTMSGVAYEWYKNADSESNFIDIASENAVTLERLSTGEDTLTEVQIECLKEKLGSERVEAIYTTGETPTPQEIMIGMTCL